MASKKLTIKETKLVKAKARGKTHVEASKEAGYSTKGSDRTIQTEVNNTLKKPHVRAALDKAMLKHAITLENAVKPIGKALKAKKTVQIEGDFYETEVDDLDMQLKGSDRALKLMNIGQNTEGATFNFTQIINEGKDKYV